MKRTIYYRKYREKTREKTRKYQAEYRRKNKEKVRFWQKRWADKNRERRREINKEYDASPRGIYTKLRWKCIKENIPFDWEFSEFKDWYSRQEKRCFYCGVKEENMVGKRMSLGNKRNHRLTFDRIISSKGYCKDNIVFSCLRCNVIKSDFFTQKEMLEIADKFIKPKL